MPLLTWASTFHPRTAPTRKRMSMKKLSTPNAAESIGLGAQLTRKTGRRSMAAAAAPAGAGWQVLPSEPPQDRLQAGTTFGDG